jgi:hypothetical protein
MPRNMEKLANSTNFKAVMEDRRLWARLRLVLTAFLLETGNKMFDTTLFFFFSKRKDYRIN